MRCLATSNGSHDSLCVIGPIALATFSASLLSFFVRIPMPISAPAIDIRIGIGAFLRFLSMSAICARKYASSGALFFLLLEIS